MAMIIPLCVEVELLRGALKNLTRRRGDTERNNDIGRRSRRIRHKFKSIIYRDEQDKQDENQRLAAYGFKINKI
jgi:hypothetical protein